VNYVNAAVQAAFAQVNVAVANVNYVNTAMQAAFAKANTGGGGAGVNVSNSYTWTNTHYFTANVASQNNITGTIVVTGGVGITGSAYVSYKIGWANASYELECGIYIL
jgi:hypothetical protein